MSWTASCADTAWRDLDRLPAKLARAIVEFSVYTLPENPQRPLHGAFDGRWSARRGDYRVLFYLADPDQLVVVRARHRRDAYRPPAPETGYGIELSQDKTEAMATARSARWELTA